MERELLDRSSSDNDQLRQAYRQLEEVRKSISKEREEKNREMDELKRQIDEMTRDKSQAQNRVANLEVKFRGKFIDFFVFFSNSHKIEKFINFEKILKNADNFSIFSKILQKKQENYERKMAETPQAEADSFRKKLEEQLESERKQLQENLDKERAKYEEERNKRMRCEDQIRLDNDRDVVKDKLLEEKNRTIADKDRMIEEKDRIIEEKDREIEKLRAQIALMNEQKVKFSVKFLRKFIENSWKIQMKDEEKLSSTIELHRQSEVARTRSDTLRVKAEQMLREKEEIIILAEEKIEKQKEIVKNEPQKVSVVDHRNFHEFSTKNPAIFSSLIFMIVARIEISMKVHIVQNPGEMLLLTQSGSTQITRESLSSQTCDEAQKRFIDIANELLMLHSSFRGRPPIGYTYYDVATSFFDGSMLW